MPKFNVEITIIQTIKTTARIYGLEAVSEDDVYETAGNLAPDDPRIVIESEPDDETDIVVDSVEESDEEEHADSEETDQTDENGVR